MGPILLLSYQCSHLRWPHRINIAKRGPRKEKFLVYNELETILFKQGGDIDKVLFNVDFQDYLFNLPPVCIFDALENVQLALFYVYF